MNVQPVGVHLRQWRQRRRMSQLDLASEAEISARHLSFVETGRATPSREMILHLAEQLAIPMRERNVLLVAAGYAPIFPERPLSDPALGPIREAIDKVLEGLKPYPAFALDRNWNIVASNRALQPMYAGVDPKLLEPPVNAMRLSLHPNGLAPRIENLAEWRGHLLHRLRAQVELTADPALVDLLKEISAYPAPAPPHVPSPDPIAIPFRLRVRGGVLSFFSTTMVFGTPVDVTLSELAVESFFPADAATVELVKQLEAA
ncbi:MAG: helix-turn-helix transcriptional regulator [Alphaproteobacteria bacterium]|nr:helix-turn-helix transcriptional regulator [Alphaproteobacteria bacterium]MBL7098155.1 helix-turn-helix transcriptional regulator [Alphaproteobacteria bacterium]